MKTGQFFKHSGIYAISNILRQIVGFVMLPVYTTYLTPSDYGVVGLLIFLVSLIEIIFGMQLFQALPKYYHSNESAEYRRKLISTAFLSTVLASSLATGGLIASSELASSVLFDSASYSVYVTIFAFLIAFHAIEQYALILIRIKKSPQLFLGFSVSKLILQLSFNLTLVVVLEMGLMGIALSSLASSAIMSIVSTLYISKYSSSELDYPIFKELVIFSWPLWLSGLIGLYTGGASRVFVKISTDLESVGLFELAAKFASIVVTLIWFPISQYWQTERFEIVKSNNADQSFKNAHQIIVYLLSVAALGMILLSPIVVRLMSAPSFYPATAIIPFLTIAGLFQSLTIFRNFSFIHVGKTIEISKINMITAALLTCFCLILGRLMGLTGIAVAVMIVFSSQYFITKIRSSRFYALHLNDAFLIRSVTILLIATASNYFVSQNASLLLEFGLRAIIVLALIIALTIDLIFVNDALRQKLTSLYLKKSHRLER